MSAFKYQWNQTIDVGTAGLLSKQWTSIRHILSLLVTANACVHITAYVAVRRSLSTTYTAVVLGLLLRQYVSYQFGVWAGHPQGSLFEPNFRSQGSYFWLDFRSQGSNFGWSSVANEQHLKAICNQRGLIMNICGYRPNSAPAPRLYEICLVNRGPEICWYSILYY